MANFFDLFFLPQKVWQKIVSNKKCHKIIMKNSKNIRDILGVTQEDLANLLKVTRTQLSMYELGKRDLPATAKEQLAKILQYMQEKQLKQDSTTMLMKTQMLHQKKVLEHMLQTNQYKQLLLEKKKKAIEKKYYTNLSALQLMQFLEKEHVKHEVRMAKLVKVIKNKATTEVEKNGLAVLTKFHIEKEVLLAEEKMLRKFLSA